MCNFCRPPSRLNILNEETTERMEKAMDFVKLIKDVKYLKLLSRFKLDNDLQTKFQIYHCNKNVIDLDKYSTVYLESEMAQQEFKMVELLNLM